MEKRKAKDFGKELEELSTKIQRARYVQKSVKNRLADVSTSSKRVVTFGRRTEIQFAETEPRCQMINISFGPKVKSENVVKTSKGDKRKKIVWP